MSDFPPDVIIPAGTKRVFIYPQPRLESDRKEFLAMLRIEGRA